MPRATGWRESSFLSSIKKSLLEKGVFFHKLRDLPHFEGAKTRFDDKKPFDAVAVYRGIPIAIEAKTQKHFGAFSFARALPPHQIEGLDEFQVAGGLSFVFLNLYLKRVPGKPGTNTYTFFYWPEVRDRIDVSIKKKEILELKTYPGSATVNYDVDDFLAKVSSLK